MTDEAPDVFTMSPQQATDRLAEIGKAYTAQSQPAAPAAPPAGTPATTAAQAAARLAQLRSDPTWRDKLLTGAGPQLREFQNLTALVASGDVQSDTLIETIDSISDPNALRRSHYEGLMDGLRDGGMNAVAEAYIRDLDSGARTDRGTEGDKIALKAYRDRLMRSPELREKYLSGANVKLTNLMNAIGRAIALCADDGRPLSAEGRELLAELENLR